MKKQIPNIITLCNLLCGTVATYYAVVGQLDIAALFIVIGIVFDFFDGLVARILRVASPMGKELDSLADVVTSGVAPALMLMHIFSNAGWGYFSLLALLITAFSAFRLAKFNLDTRQSHSFLGLPVPSNALIWVALGAVYSNRALLDVALIVPHAIADFCFSPMGLLVLLAIEIVGCVLMVSEVPLFALKIRNLSWNANKVRYIFVVVDIVLLLLLGIMALPLIIIWYIVLSLCFPNID